MPLLSRRQTLIGLTGSLAGCVGFPRWPSMPELAGEGRSILSQSVQCGVASSDGRFQATVRLCRYPEAGIAWQWAHLLLDGELYAFTRHDARCRPGTGIEAVAGTPIADADNDFVFERLDPEPRARAVEVRARCGLRKSAAALHGFGPHSGDIRLNFQPLLRYAGLLPDRTEVFGRGSAKITIAGRSFAFDGQAQYHEQVQTIPRFVVPFGYATLWAGDAGMTLLITPRGSGGYLVTLERSTDMANIAISAPDEARAITLIDTAGTKLAFVARVRSEYAIPVYGHTWRGAMVSAEFADRRWVGHINDFRPTEVPYRSS
jgi:hypothetical protein